MLPAISADLPALLIPPSNKEVGQTTNTDTGFGPSARVELSIDRAIQAQSNEPNADLYGPDGRFVESAARKKALEPNQEDNHSGRTEQAPRRETGENASQVRNERTGGQTERNLTLAEFDSAVPPAAKEELRALADHVERKSTSQSLSPRDYKRLSELFDRVGRFGDSKQALDRARELETPQETQQETQADETRESADSST